MKNAPEKEVICCYNCIRWHKKHYIHCQCSGPWGGDLHDKNCDFKSKYEGKEKR